jgi:hypothetical protein
MDYEELKKDIDENYPALIKAQAEWLEEHWRDFNLKKSAIESIVSEEFERVLREIGPIPIPEWILARESHAENPKILGYKTEYDSQFKKFRIKITKFRLPTGEIMDDADVLSSRDVCPHVYLGLVCGFLDEIHPKIKDFEKKYLISYIREPNNDCEHK